MALKRNGRMWLAAVVIIAGGILLWIAHELGAHGILEFTLSHLGIAAAVAGAVGVLYEYGSNRDEYDERVRALTSMGSRNAPEQLEGALLSLFPILLHDDAMSEFHVKLREHISTIVKMTQTIEAETGRSRMVLLRFVKKLLEYASDASKTLPNGGKLNLPRTANELAADILSEQMAAMIENDVYEVISDFTTWRNAELDPFRDKIKDVAKGNVRIRRVFARFDHDAKNMSEAEARVILNKHWAIACDYPNYELAVSVDMFEHVGTFRCGGTPISFRPPDGDLSQMTVQRAAYDRFNDCWNSAIKVRPSQKVPPIEFDDLCNELTKRYSAWWTRFYGPARAADVSSF